MTMRKREKPDDYAGDDPKKLARQLTRDLDMIERPHDFDDYEESILYVGEIKLLIAALKAYKPPK
jgi:hypothetical protein